MKTGASGKGGSFNSGVYTAVYQFQPCCTWQYVAPPPRHVVTGRVFILVLDTELEELEGTFFQPALSCFLGGFQLFGTMVPVSAGARSG